MGKTRRSGRDYDMLDKLKRENRKLKRQVDQLRKQISRLDLDRYTNIKELINKHDREHEEHKLQEHEAKLKKLWECWSCGRGVMIFVPFLRRDGEFYFRKCNTCGHRTKLKRMTKDVKKGPKDDNKS